MAAIRSPTTQACAAQLASAFRVAGTAHTVAGLTVLAMTVRRETVLQRVIADATRVCRHPPEVITNPRHTHVRLVDTDGLVTQAAVLLTRHGQHGPDGHRQPPAATRADLTAMWRGAFLLAGQITPTPQPTATIRCRDHATAHILAGIAHRLRIPAALRSLPNNGARLVVSDVGDLEALVNLISAAPHG